MKGFEINHNGKVISVAIEDGLLMIDTFHLEGKGGNLYVGGVDYEKQIKVAWYDNEEIDLGDRFEIKVTEMESSSKPKKCEYDKDIKSPISKLDRLRSMRKYLKKQGLL